MKTVNTIPELFGMIGRGELDPGDTIGCGHCPWIGTTTKWPPHLLACPDQTEFLVGDHVTVKRFQSQDPTWDLTGCRGRITGFGAGYALVDLDDGGNPFPFPTPFPLTDLDEEDQ